MNKKIILFKNESQAKGNQICIYLQNHEKKTQNISMSAKGILVMDISFFLEQKKS